MKTYAHVTIATLQKIHELTGRYLVCDGDRQEVTAEDENHG